MPAVTNMIIRLQIGLTFYEGVLGEKLLKFRKNSNRLHTRWQVTLGLAVVHRTLEHCVDEVGAHAREHGQYVLAAVPLFLGPELWKIGHDLVVELNLSHYAFEKKFLVSRDPHWLQDRDGKGVFASCKDVENMNDGALIVWW